ncbi:MAG: hypothetical protein ABF303_14765, partial [Desulfobacterales bacterium]
NANHLLALGGIFLICLVLLQGDVWAFELYKDDKIVLNADLTNLHYRFKSAAAPSDVYVNLSEIDFSSNEGVRTIHILDEHAQRGQFGNLIHAFVRIKGDIYDEQLD